MPGWSERAAARTNGTAGGVEQIRSAFAPFPEGGAIKPDELIRILSVEDHSVFRDGLRTLIESQPDMRLVAEAKTGEEAVSLFRVHRPDITLMDLRLPGISGVDAITAIRGSFPEARILVLTTVEEDDEMERASRAGAAGYILKSTPRNELLASIRRVHTGHPPG